MEGVLLSIPSIPQIQPNNWKEQPTVNPQYLPMDWNSSIEQIEETVAPKK
jgi:hypothetical protein